MPRITIFPLPVCRHTFPPSPLNMHPACIIGTLPLSTNWLTFNKTPTKSATYCKLLPYSVESGVWDTAHQARRIGEGFHCYSSPGFSRMRRRQRHGLLRSGGLKACAALSVSQTTCKSARPASPSPIAAGHAARIFLSRREP